MLPISATEEASIEQLRHISAFSSRAKHFSVDWRDSWWKQARSRALCFACVVASLVKAFLLVYSINQNLFRINFCLHCFCVLLIGGGGGGILALISLIAFIRWMRRRCTWQRKQINKYLSFPPEAAYRVAT